MSSEVEVEAFTITRQKLGHTRIPNVDVCVCVFTVFASVNICVCHLSIVMGCVQQEVGVTQLLKLF